MTKPKPWYVGLHCRQCGTLVKQGGSGYYCFPLGAEPWAECGPCREGKNQRFKFIKGVKFLEPTEADLQRGEELAEEHGW